MPFDYSTIFSGAEAGEVWLADGAHFQDTARTTAADVDDPVGSLSGDQGNFNGEQSTARPTLRQDGGSGKRYLEHDADFFVVGTAGDFNYLHNSNNDYYICAAINFGNTTDPDAVYGIIGTRTTSTSSIGTLIFWSDAFTANKRIGVNVSNGSSLVLVRFEDDALPAQTDAIIEFIRVGSDVTCYLNGTELFSGTQSGNSTADHGTALRIGARGNDDNPLTGRLYGLLVTDTVPSEADRAGIQYDMDQRLATSTGAFEDPSALEWSLLAPWTEFAVLDWQLAAPWVEGVIDWQLATPWEEYDLEWQLATPWAELVEWQIRIPISHELIWLIRTPWREGYALAFDALRVPWAEGVLDWQVSAPWAEPIEWAVLTPWGEPVALDWSVSAPWVEGALGWSLSAAWIESVDWQVSAPWKEAATVEWSVSVPWTENAVEWSLSMPWTEHLDWSLTIPITFAHDVAVEWSLDAPWAELDTVPVDWRLRAPWVERADVYQSFADPITVTIAGQTVDIEECRIAADLDSPYWQVDITLSRLADYALFVRSAAFAVDFYGTVYQFVTDTRSLSRGIDDSGNPTDQVTVSGLSPLATRATPRAQTVTVTFGQPTTARAIAQQLLGEVVTWEIIDWPIPAFGIGFDQRSPLAAAQEIAAAVGAVILSDPDGSIVVRSRYPVSVPRYPTATPDISLTGLDVYSVQESIRAVEYYNRVAIQSVADDLARQDRLEFVADEADGLRGTVRAYPSPWIAAARVTTDRAGVSLARIGERYRAEVETVAIIDGRGTTRYPISAITGLSWQSTNLGGIAWEGSEITTTTPGYTLVELTYRVRSIDYSAVAAGDLSALMLLRDD